MNVDALRRDLESAIEGEVRFDPISRALYSTDASVYQIEPLGVVVVEVARRRRPRRCTICRKHRCPLTMRGGGTSQAGQAIGSGVIVDTSKYFNRLLEVNAAGALGAGRAGHRARRAERGAAAARPALRAGHLDREPRHRRRHDGQQLEPARARCSTARPSTTCSSSRSCSRTDRSRTSGRSTGSELDDAVRTRRRSKARAIARSGAPARAARGRDRAPLSEGAAPRRRLQPRRVRRPRPRRSTWRS